MSDSVLLAHDCARGVRLIAGAVQFTSFKAHQLDCCREAPGRTLPAHSGKALRFGVGLGLHCCYCCANLMAVLLAVGVMDLRAMTLLTAAIAVERLGPRGQRVAKGLGAVLVAAGLFLIARATLPA